MKTIYFKCTVCGQSFPSARIYASHGCIQKAFTAETRQARVEWLFKRGACSEKYYQSIMKEFNNGTLANG